MRFTRVLICLAAAAIPSAIPDFSAAQNPDKNRPSLVGTLDLNEQQAAPQGNPNLVGTIELEKEKKEEPSYLSIQDATIAYFEKLQGIMAEIAAGRVPQMEYISDELLRHAATAYLFCSIKKGVCPEYLLTVREIDIINAVLMGKKDAECQTLKRFWERWLKNDMQAKMEHQVSFSHIKMRTDFNRSTLPSFLPQGCKEALTAAVEESAAAKSEFWKKRYSAADSPKEALTKVLQMLKFFKARNLDLVRMTMPR